MTVFQALFLGVLQGVTEFLPISSSGHLVLAQRLMNVNLGGADMLFDLTLHLGTLLAVLAVYRKKIAGLFARPFKRLLYLFAATVPAGAAGLLLGDVVDGLFYGGMYLAAGFAFTAVLLAAARRCSLRREGLPLNGLRASVMGLAQAVAIVPGISRSGATIAAGILSGAGGEEAADFSFLMSIPVISGGFAVTLAKGIADGGLYGVFAASGGELGVCIAVGLAASATAGFFSIKFMKGCASSGRYVPFIVYLAILSAVCFALGACGIL